MEYLKKLFVGFLYGAGASLGFLLVAHLYQQYTISEGATVPNLAFEERNQERNALRQKKIEAKALIEIEDRGMNRGAMGPEYMFTMRNQSSYKFTWVFPVVDLFDQSGAFLYRCQGNGINPFPPGDTQHSVVSCRDLSREIYEQSAAYEIRIERAD